MYCHICGNKLDDEDIFCGKCGAKVKKPNQTEPTAKPEEPVENVPQAAGTLPEEPVTAESEASGSSGVQEESVNPEKDTDSTETENTDDAESETEKDKAAPTEDLAFEFRPKEFAEEDISGTQSNIFRPIPDIVIADASENPEAQKKKSGAKVVQAVCSVLLSLFVFAFTAVLVLQVFIRFGFTEEKLKEAFNNVDYKEIKASSILNLQSISEKYGKQIPEDATLAEAVYEMIDQKELVNPISKSEVERLIERLDFQDFMAEKSSKAVSILRSSSMEQPVYADEIIAFLKKNEEEIEKTIGIKMLDVDYDYMQKYLEEHNDELLDVLSEKNVTGTENSFGYMLIRFFCSDWFIAVLGALIIAIAVAIGFINKKVASALLYAGTPIAVAGIILLFGGIFYEFLLTVLSNHIPTDFIRQFATPVIGSLTVVSAVAVGIGVVMIVVGVVLKATKNRKSKKQLPEVKEN